MSQIHSMFSANSTINGFIVNIKSLFDQLCGQGFNKGHIIYTKTKYIWWKVTARAPDIVYNTKLVHSS